MNTEDAISTVIKFLYGIGAIDSLCIWADGKCAPLSPAGWNPLLNIKTPAPKFELRFLDLGISLQTPFDQVVNDKKVRNRIVKIFKIHGVPIESLHPFTPQDIH